LQEAVDASANLEVDLAVVNVLHEVVFINEVLRDAGELEFDVFRTIQRGAEIEVGDVEGAELGYSRPDLSADCRRRSVLQKR
jgi:hypothetical protein